MKKILYPFLLGLMLCVASCESGEAPVLGAIVVDEVTTGTIACHVEVSGGEMTDYGFYYGTSKSSVQKGMSDKVAGTLDLSVMSATIVNLTANKEYYVKAYGMNEFGKGESVVVKVKTLAITPGENDNTYPSIKP